MIIRANEILKTLEKKVKIKEKQSQEEKKQVSGQLDMYNYKLADVATELDKIDINDLTPIEALNALVKIKEKLK
jgi:DNA mismatch repair ATPase MutS